VSEDDVCRRRRALQTRRAKSVSAERCAMRDIAPVRGAAAEAGQADSDRATAAACDRDSGVLPPILRPPQY